MKYIKFIFILFSLVYACKSEPKRIAFKTISINKAYNAQIEVTFDKALGNNALSRTINSKIEASIIASLSENKETATLADVLDNFNEAFLNFKKEFPDVDEPTWELYIETEKTYQSNNIITIAISTYLFKGGAHGNDNIYFLNLNAKTGEILNKNDIIKDFNGFKKLAKAYFIKSLQAEKENVVIEDFFYGKSFQLPQSIGYSDDGLILLYNNYEIASYEPGYTEFIIPFDDAETFLKVN